MLAWQEVPGEFSGKAGHADPEGEEEAPEVIVDDAWVLQPEDDDIPVKDYHNYKSGTNFLFNFAFRFCTLSACSCSLKTSYFVKITV
jgi:hypothetical protein